MDVFIIKIGFLNQLDLLFSVAHSSLESKFNLFDTVKKTAEIYQKSIVRDSMGRIQEGGGVILDPPLLRTSPFVQVYFSV